MRTRITPNTDTFYAVQSISFITRKALWRMIKMTHQFIPSYARITGQRVTKQKLSSKGVLWKRPTTLLKKRTWHRCFPVKFAKFLKTPFLIKHLRWLLLYDIKCIYGKLRPVNPPSVFNSCVKPSLFPRQTPPPRSTKQAHSLTQNTQPDEIEVFIPNHRIASYKELKQN